MVEGCGGQVLAAELVPAAGFGPGPQFVADGAVDRLPAQFDGVVCGLGVEGRGRELGIRGSLLGRGRVGG